MNRFSIDYRGDDLKRGIEAVDLKQVLEGYNRLVIDASRLPFRRNAEFLSLSENNKTLATYSAEDASSFRRIATAEQPLETVGEVLLTVKSPVLEGDGKWRFRYGSKTILVQMNDSAFRREVESGRESFRNGDIYKVKLRSRQERTGRQIRTHHVIERVLGKV